MRMILIRFWPQPQVHLALISSTMQNHSTADLSFCYNHLLQGLITLFLGVNIPPCPLLPSCQSSKLSIFGTDILPSATKGSLALNLRTTIYRFSFTLSRFSLEVISCGNINLCQSVACTDVSKRVSFLQTGRPNQVHLHSPF